METKAVVYLSMFQLNEGTRKKRGTPSCDSTYEQHLFMREIKHQIKIYGFPVALHTLGTVNVLFLPKMTSVKIIKSNSTGVAN